jgi:hypothetical protein
MKEPDIPKTEIELEIASKNYLDWINPRWNWHKYVVSEFRDRGTKNHTIRILFYTESKSRLRIWMDLNSLKPARASIKTVNMERLSDQKAFMAKIILERS